MGERSSTFPRPIGCETFLHAAGGLERLQLPAGSVAQLRSIE
jgi:hypothetical protein